MEFSNNKRLVSRYAMVHFFLYQLFKENLINIDTYVFALNMAKEECGQVQNKKYFCKAAYAYSSYGFQNNIRIHPLERKVAYPQRFQQSDVGT